MRSSAALIKEYDADQDGVLWKAEVNNFPAAQGALNFSDQDNDGIVTRDEMQA